MLKGVCNHSHSMQYGIAASSYVICTSEVSQLRQAARLSESAPVQRGFAAKELEWVQEQDVPDLSLQDNACPFMAAMTQAEGMSEEALARWMDSVPTAGQAGLSAPDQPDEAPKRRKVCSAAEDVNCEDLDILWDIASGEVFPVGVLHSYGRHVPDILVKQHKWCQIRQPWPDSLHESPELCLRAASAR